MITKLKFKNFRILQDATLPLGRVTVIIGPNGSGKSTALNAIRAAAKREKITIADLISVGLSDESSIVSVSAEFSDSEDEATAEWKLEPIESFEAQRTRGRILAKRLSEARIFSLDPTAIAAPSDLQKTLQINEDGSNLPSVLTTLQDQYPERFELLNVELHRWMPEFDRVLLDTHGKSQRGFMLRTTIGRHRIPSQKLSEGTLIVVALVALTHLPVVPTLVALEEIDRGIHPRLLRDVQDAVMRLAYPENYGDDREPVQVIMTTHSPYFVDLFRDHPEDIVIAEKEGLTANFKRLIDLPNVEEILRDSHLGEAWFTGVLGGVPVGT